MSCCAECGNEIPIAKTNFHLPPWCPGCGADLKLTDKPAGLKTPLRSAAPPAPVHREAVAPGMSPPVTPSRRPILSSESRADVPLPDGYMLDAPQNQSKNALQHFRKESLYYGIACGVFLFLTLWVANASVEKLRSWKRVAGTVANVETYTTRRGRSASTYQFNYSVAGKIQKANRWFDMTLGSYNLNDRVTVVYNPADPSEGMVLCFSNLWGWVIVLLLPTLFCGMVAGSSLYFRRIEERAAEMP